MRHTAVRALLTNALLASLLVAPPIVAAAEAGTTPAPRDVAGVRVIDAHPGAATVWSAESRAVRGPRTVTWPAPGRVAITPTTGKADSSATVHIGPAKESSGDPPAQVSVTVHDRSATGRAGVKGLLLSVDRPDGRRSGTVSVAVSYRAFADAYGADWATRLRLVRLPACVLSTPDLPSCTATAPLATINDAKAGTLTADVPVAGEQATVLATEAGPSGPNGDYTATGLSPAATWQVSNQTGNFSWSYPLRMPPALGGPAPSVTLAYTSGSVDGRTGTSNNQGGWVGDGWESWPGFIERKYASCTDDNPGHKTGDLCWSTDNATLSLDGHAGELIQAGGVWRLKDDDGTRIERLTDANRANGDNDNEYWRVTTTDGVQYFFGYHRLPGWTSGKPVTNSTWTVPVFGNNAGEPCYNATFANAHCAQAWRWNLDYVVDPHANTMTYFYGREAGAYGRDNTPSQRTGYDRGGWLDRVEYGTRQGNEYAEAAPLRVRFATAERCLSGCWTGAVWTSDPVPSAWPDTPWDQYCKTAPCNDQLSPTFWSARRLTRITTQLRTGTTSYADVESWALRQEFLNAGVAEGTPMWLRGLTRTGHVTSAGGAATADPEITFNPGSDPLPNRVDSYSDGRTGLNRWRIKAITTESGGQILITYSGPDCAYNNLPVPHTNTRRCMPAFYAPPGTGDPTLDWFHKYVVARVDLHDAVTDQPDQTIFYDYLDSPAWHYNDDEITVDKYRTWADWRGYGRVQVRRGSATGQQTAAEYRYLRGMDGDRLPSGTRSVSVPDIWGGSIVDHEALNGFALQEITFNGPGGAEVSSTLNEPWKNGPTATRTRNGITTRSWKVNTGSTRARTALAAGGFRTTRTGTEYNTDGLPVAQDTFGDENAGGDETCTRTTYARNDSLWMIDKVAQTETHAGTCASPGAALARSRTFYDSYTGEPSFGAPPTRGDVVRTEQLDRWNGATPVYVATASSSYDSHGRVTATTDARGYTTTTDYATANGGLVTQTDVINPLGHRVITTREPAWDVPTRITDPNGVVTDLTYDGLGRLTNVWLPGRPRATNPNGPSLRFSYLVRNTGGPTAVTSDTLLPTGAGYRTSISLLDGWLRQRQTQVQAPGGGRTLTDTFHTAAGQPDWTSAPYYDSTNAAPSVTLGSPQGQIPAITRHGYDGAGRETATIFTALGTEKWRTTIGYGGDRVHTTPPAGGTATTSITDARGRTTELRQYKTFADVGSTDPSRYVRTGYTHTLLDQPATITDQLGNTWSHTYDLRGRRTQTVDPDSGTTTSTYDVAGNVQTVAAPLGVLAYTYDELGRKTSARDDTVTGTVRAQWVYDTLPNGKGKLTSATRFTGGNAYTTRTDSFDTFGRPTATSVVLPTVQSGLCVAAAPNTCTYTTTTTYKADSQISSITLPTAADLASEKLIHGYTDVGAPYSLISPIEIYSALSYNKLGQLTQRIVGDSSVNRHTAITYSFDEPTRRLTAANVVPVAKPEALNDTYTYDDVGNITRITDAPAGQVADHQCFAYDHLRRLTEAWSPGTGSCATPSYPAVGGPSPYWHQWTFDATGNRITETRKVSTGDTTFTSTHPPSGSGSVRPHAVTSITATGAASWTRNYTYDNAGNTTTRPNQTLTWDREGRLSAVAGTGYLYDADGNRIIRTDPNGSKTLYLPGGTEVRHDQPSNTTKATRYYAHAGATLAVRTATGLNWIVGDHHSTAELTIDAATLTVAKRRTLPYGEPRHTTGTWPSTMDKGFVGGTLDPTGLTHLGAREYDPATGRFISPDPLTDPSDPQSLHRYAYSANNPTTRSDPTGLSPHICLDECGGADDQKNQANLRDQRKQQLQEQQRRDAWQCRRTGKCNDEPPWPRCTAYGPRNCHEQRTEREPREQLGRFVLEMRDRSKLAGPAASACERLPDWLCNRHNGEAQMAWCMAVGPAACRHGNGSSQAATYLADRLDDERGWSGGQRNAFRHAYWMALMTGQHGFQLDEALVLGAAHEIDVTDRGHEWGSNNSVIDMHNNLVGALVGSRMADRGSADAGDIEWLIITLVESNCGTGCALNMQGT